jgi:4'-phosphopantetheinyl transferase
MPDPKMNWPSAPATLSLGARDVHLWSAVLDKTSDQIAKFNSTLSPEEQNRAARFHFDRDRNRFIAGRGLLRDILGRYLQTAPSEIKFSYTDRGKPSLDGMPPGAALHFNLSHSHAFALLAVTRLCPVGIDVELIRPLKDAEAIAERFFSPRESAALAALPPEHKPVGFFNLWTRKEAWLKATGEGISNSLNQVEVSLLPGEPAKLISLFGKTAEAADWTLQDLSPAAEFKGALAIPATNLRLECWSWVG